MGGGDGAGRTPKDNDILEQISRKYGKPEEKQREAVKKLGKDEFFKIMINQIQHQDPMKPYDNEQMAAQMAQFTALEQMVNVNQNLEKLTQAQTAQHGLGAAHLIGKYVTGDSSRVLHTEGRYTDLNFELPADAAKVSIALVNDRGEKVRELDAYDLKKGATRISWDGKRSNAMIAPSGQYLMQITAETANGQ